MYLVIEFFVLIAITHLWPAGAQAQPRRIQHRHLQQQLDQGEFRHSRPAPQSSEQLPVQVNVDPWQAGRSGPSEQVGTFFLFYGRLDFCLFSVRPFLYLFESKWLYKHITR
jgi:hypothetical protein